MKNINSIDYTNEAHEESNAEKNKSAESSIFSTILANIEENPTIVQKQKRLSVEFSVFSTILVDIDEESPKMNPIDFTSMETSQTLTPSDLVNNFDQELKILKSELETFIGQTCDRYVSCNCDCVEDKVVQRKAVQYFLADEVIEWLLSTEIDSEISRCSADAEDSVCKVEDANILETLDEMIPTMLGDDDEQVNSAEDCGLIGEFFEEMLEKVEEDGSYLDQIKDCYVFGGLLETLLRERLITKGENEICSWISNGEPEVETIVAEEEKEAKGDIKERKKMTSMEVEMERTEQESTVSRHDCVEYKRWLYLVEKAREQHENRIQRREKAFRYGVKLSLLVANLMFLIPNKILASETEDYSTCTKLFGISEDDKGTSLVMRKLEAVFRIVIWKKVNKEHNVDLHESIFRYGDIFCLCRDAILVLGKIVWALQKKQNERLELSELDSLFEDCRKVLTKIELKLEEMKHGVYRSVSADYESFSKSERLDSFLKEKMKKRVNADNRFASSNIGPYIMKIWITVFQAEALHKQ